MVRRAHASEECTMKVRRRVVILAGVPLLIAAGAAVFFATRTRPNRVDEPKPVRYQLPQTIVVEAAYPGADARTVADTLAAPIEQQVNGVEHMLSMSSQSASDGSYCLRI